MNERRLIQGSYLCLTMELLHALEERDLDKAYLLKKKRHLFDVYEREQPHHLRKMEESIFDGLTQRAPSWIEALTSYTELIENTPRPEGLRFLWTGC